MSYLDDNLPDFSNLDLPEDGLVPTFADSPSAASSAASSGVNAGQLVSAGASLMGGIGAYMEGKEKQEADEYNANIALMKGTFDVEQLGLEESSMLATQRAVYARAGVEMSGSPLDVALSTATQFEYSKQVANFNAQSQANMDEYEGKVAAQQGEFGLAGGILGAIGKLI